MFLTTTRNNLVAVAKEIVAANSLASAAAATALRVAEYEPIRDLKERPHIKSWSGDAVQMGQYQGGSFNYIYKDESDKATDKTKLVLKKTTYS